MAPDGSSVQLLVLYDEEGGLQAVGPRPPEGPVDVAGCAAGTAVPRPEANPGLVQDCETLLVLQAKLAGVGGLGWTTDQPLKEWDGVLLGDPRLGVYRPPLRVRRLLLRGLDLRGEIPPELAQLTQLSWLDLGNNNLEGDIPAAFGALTELEILDLSWNYLSGAIPADLGGLLQLRSLVLGFNLFTGEIPAVLGQLKSLQVLELVANQLTGGIPAEIGELRSLYRLSLFGNDLTGCIPPALLAVESNDLSSLELRTCESG